MEGASSSETVKQTRYITQCKDLEDHHFCNIPREDLNTYQYSYCIHSYVQKNITCMHIANKSN
jgi:hypothetical protein